MATLYVEYEYWVAAFQLVFAMLGMGATLTIKDFKDVVSMPRAVSIGLFIQLLIVPLTAFAFISLNELNAGLLIGIALISAIPGGTTSNIFTYIARGNVPLSISITSLTTLTCLFTTPLMMNLLAADSLPNSFNMPTKQIVSDIAFTLLLPLIIGMATLYYLPSVAKATAKWSIRLSMLGILIILIGSSSSGRLNLEAFGTANLILVTAFISILTIISLLSSKLFTLSPFDSNAINMEVIVRNVNLAVLIKASIFPATTNSNDTIGDTVLFTILLYGGLQMLIAAILIILKRRQLALS